MKTLRCSIRIKASKEKVWNTMLEPETFKVWTAAFAEGSYYEGSWKKGARIRFLTPEGEGLISMIVENTRFKFISIKHLGLIKNGVEDLESPESKAWAPAFENYTLAVRDDATEVIVDMEVTPDFEDFMQKTWPKALDRLKAICEA